MYSHRTTRRPLLLALACVMAFALAIPAFVSADGPSPYTSERDSAASTPPPQSLNGDIPSERGDTGTVSTASSAGGSSSSDDGTNVALIVGLSLAGLAAGGTAWVVVRRRHRGRLTARPSH
jgi:hypothetical protein